jgi:hypothetical protein
VVACVGANDDEANVMQRADGLLDQLRRDAYGAEASGTKASKAAGLKAAATKARNGKGAGETPALRNGRSRSLVRLSSVGMTAHRQRQDGGREGRRYEREKRQKSRRDTFGRLSAGSGVTKAGARLLRLGILRFQDEGGYVVVEGF